MDTNIAKQWGNGSWASLLFVLMLTACGGGNLTQTTATPAPAANPAITSAGTDFYLTLPDHLCVSSPAVCFFTPVSDKLIVAAATATTGTVTFNGVSTPFSVAASGETVITLDPAVVLTTNDIVAPKAIHVTSQAPVSVYVVSENATSADGYLGLPTPGLGTNYYVMSYASSGYTGSEFALAATQANTTVTITPAVAAAGHPAGVSYTVALNAGDTYQLQNTGYADMTGSHVTSDKPIAVFGGHRCTDVPSGVGYCDYLVEELTDVSLWGKTFHTVPFSGRARYTVRIMASQNGTTVASIPAGLVTGTLNAGQYVELTLSGNAEFTASAPVQVAQYIRGYADDAAGKGDPSMVMVTPAEMSLNSATFGIHGLAGTTGSYINIVTPTSALANLKLDNTVVNGALFTPIGGASTYSVATLPVAPGAHTLSGSSPFSALAYDFGIPFNAVSYAYPLASMLSVATAAPASGVAPATGCVRQPAEPGKDGKDGKGDTNASQQGEAEQSASGDRHDEGQVCPEHPEEPGRQ